MNKDRIYTATFILLVLASIFLIRYFENLVFDFFWLILVYACAYEILKLAKRRELPLYKFVIYAYPAIFLGLCYIAIAYNYAFYEFMFLELIFLIAIAFLLVFIPLMFGPQVFDNTRFKSRKNYIINKSLNTLNVMIYPVLLLSIMYIFNHICDLGLISSSVTNDNNTLGLFAILFVLVVSMASDTFAMIVGKLFKGKKLCPTISANKTVSGFIGGIVAGALAGFIYFYIFNSIDVTNDIFGDLGYNSWIFLIGGLIGGFATMAGDLLSSYIKRQAFVKDFAMTFPGHGGFLDRLNGVCINNIVTLAFFVIIF